MNLLLFIIWSVVKYSSSSILDQYSLNSQDFSRRVRNINHQTFYRIYLHDLSHIFSWISIFHLRNQVNIWYSSFGVTQGIFYLLHCCNGLGIHDISRIKNFFVIVNLLWILISFILKRRSVGWLETQHNVRLSLYFFRNE